MAPGIAQDTMGGTGPGWGVTGLDHVIVGVRDLEAARAAWQRLGFTVTPRGRHIGWGTGNYCVMFAHDYVELLGIVDAELYTHGLDAFLARREGLLGLALATPDADAAQAEFLAAGVSCDPPRDLARILELPEGEVRPAFRNVYPNDSGASGESDAEGAGKPFAVSAFACQHLTPDLVRRPEWLRHANTATGIRILTGSATNLSPAAWTYRALFGDAAVLAEPEALTVNLGRNALHLGRVDPVTGADDPTGLLGMAVRVADLDAAAAVLRDKGVDFRREDGSDGPSLDIAPGSATGVALSFVTG